MFNFVKRWCCKHQLNELIHKKKCSEPVLDGREVFVSVTNTLKCLDCTELHQKEYQWIEKYKEENDNG